MERISHYEILRLLGRGGMGEVHEALDLDLGRKVALKFIVDPAKAGPEALLRFEREARAAASLQHPGIATVFAFDRSTPRPFIVMELLGGRSLRDVLASGPLAVDEALAIGRDVAEALAFAHEQGVVHRDIKPENLMFDLQGAIKIADFGLARTPDAAHLTSTGVTPGTAAYMAPESLGMTAAPSSTGAPPAGPAGAPADVFALGVTLHEMLAGRTPFAGAHPVAMMYAIAHQPPSSLREARPEAPPEVEALLSRMLEKDPSKRMTAAAVADALAELTGSTRSRTGRIVSAPDPARRPRSRAAMLVAVGAVVVLVAAGWWYQASRATGQARAVALNNEGHDSLVAGHRAAARERFEAALEAAPRYGEAKLNLANVLHQTGEENAAARLYAQVLAENPKRTELLAAAHYGLGEMDLHAGAWPSATTHLREATERDSTRAEYPNNLAFALIQAGRAADALEVLRSARVRFPGEAALLKNTALAWFELGRADSARDAATEAVRLSPGFAAAWALRARSEAWLQDLPAARASLTALRNAGADSALVAQVEEAVRQASFAGPR